MTTTLIEKDSAVPGIVLTFILILLLLGGGAGVVYMTGAYEQIRSVFEKSKTVENGDTK